jgi:hypothetical protein
MLRYGLLMLKVHLMKLPATRILQLTTGILHTNMSHIYEDLELFVGAGFYTHQLPSAANALTPFLKARYGDLTPDSDDVELIPLLKFF